MTLNDLRTLMAAHGAPCLSILLPTHRTAPENQQDLIVLKNLRTELETTLLQHIDKRTAEPYLTKLDELIAGVDVNHLLDGLAFFVNDDTAARIDTPFTLPKLAALDDTFATRELLAGKLRSLNYLALTLYAGEVHLFQGYRNRLTEVTGMGFPTDYNSVLGTGLPIRNADDKESREREFYNRIDKALNKINRQEDLPVVLIGPAENISLYRAIADQPEDLVAEIAGGHAGTKLDQLGQLCFQAVQPALEARRGRAMDRLGAAVGAGQYVSGIGEVYRMAKQKRGQLLVVEDDFRAYGTIEGEGITNLEETDTPRPGEVDLVDEAIELLILSGGEVQFVANGTLEAHRRIALVTRF